MFKCWHCSIIDNGPPVTLASYLVPVHGLCAPVLIQLPTDSLRKQWQVGLPPTWEMCGCLQSKSAEGRPFAHFISLSNE